MLLVINVHHLDVLLLALATVGPCLLGSLVIKLLRFLIVLENRSVEVTLHRISVLVVHDDLRVLAHSCLRAKVLWVLLITYELSLSASVVLILLA
jgi:hypothetical protein